jgi:hypothetical protein
MTLTTVCDDAPAIAWEHDWEIALQRARSERKLLLVDVEKDH